MRVGYSLLLAVCAASLASAMPARAQTGPVIVLPGKAGVPVIINGVIVDGAVIYGDWGLARPGQGDLIIEGAVGFAEPLESPGYYPRAGQKPRMGRQEIEPKKLRPRPTNFRRDWSASSDFRAPVTEYPPYDPPPVILAPRDRRR